MKRIDYEQRIREIEHSSFTPLVFSATGGMAKQAMTFTNAWPPYSLTKRATISRVLIDVT